jgi:hypothetical protein
MERFSTGEYSRRALLETAAVTAALGVAGCSGGDGSDETTETGTSDDADAGGGGTTSAGQSPGTESPTAEPQTQPDPVAAGLVFRMNDSLPDGFESRGVTDRPGSVVGDRVWAFDDSYIRTDYVWGERDHSGTFATWVYLPPGEINNPGPRDIISAHDDGKTGNTRFAQLGLRQRPDGDGISLVKNDVRDGAVTPSITDFPVGEWFHVAGAVDKSTDEVRVYLDGTLEATATDIDLTMEQQGVFAIGARAKNRAGDYRFDNRFVGRLDDVRAYETALDEAQIATLARRDRTALGTPRPEPDIPSVLEQSLPDPTQYIAARQGGFTRTVGTVEISTAQNLLTLRGPGISRVTAIAGYLAADEITPLSSWGKEADGQTKLIGTAAGEGSDELSFSSFRGIALRAVPGIDLVVDGQTVAEAVEVVRFTPDVGVFERTPM